MVEAIVIDNGTATIRAGFSGDEEPRVTIPTSTEAGTNPISNGTVSDWEAMEQRWRETCFDNLRVSPETQPVLLTETLKFTKEDREAATKIFFEKFETPAFYLANSAVLSLYATGRVGGVAVIVDEKSTSVVPVYESYAVKKAASNNVSNDEIPEAICNAIMRCDIDTRLEMYRNIVVSGPNADLSSIADTIKRDLHKFAAPEQESNVIVPDNAQHLSWIGGSVLAMQSNFKSAWIRREEYEEHGVSIVHKKCF